MREVILQSLGTQTSQLPIVLTPMKSFAKLENLHLYMEKRKKKKLQIISALQQKQCVRGGSNQRPWCYERRFLHIVQLLQAEVTVRDHGPCDTHSRKADMQ